MYWKYVKKKKRNIVFCLILTELFLLKYIHKHMIHLLFLFAVLSFICSFILVVHILVLNLVQRCVWGRVPPSSGGV